MRKKVKLVKCVKHMNSFSLSISLPERCFGKVIAVVKVIGLTQGEEVGHHRSPSRVPLMNVEDKANFSVNRI